MNSIVDDHVKNYLEKILAILDVEAVVHAESFDDATVCYRVECKASDAKILIGRRGQTLDTLQFMLRQMVRSGRLEHPHFIVDILNYRVRRKETVMEQAKQGAVAVLNGESEEMALVPMSAFERRIVHKYLQESFPELSSKSSGQGEDRHIVISYAGDDEGSRAENEDNGDS